MNRAVSQPAPVIGPLVQWNPRDYVAHSAAQLAWANELLARLNLRGHERILDIGCGDGRITAQVARVVTAGRIVGLDSSPEMIEFARGSHPGASHPNLEFVCQDASEMRLDGPFDVVFSNAALHWIADHAALYRAVARLMPPGARLITSCGGRGNAAEFVAVVEELTRNERWTQEFGDFPLPWSFHGADESERWLIAAGLRPIRVALVAKDMTHTDREGLAAWVRTTWLPYTQRLPEDRREAFIADAVEHFLVCHPPDSAGRTHVAMVRLEVDAMKL